jgi:hypothetical protein
VQPLDVLAGDVVLYVHPSGDIEHSAIVVVAPRDSLLRVPTVLSKWGKYAEIIHAANRCPYDFSNPEYYRAWA